MLKQLFTVMLHGRQTIVKFNDPVSLRALVDGNLGEERTLRKLSRVLRVHFRRQREMSIGLICRTAVAQVNSLLSSTSVERAIADDALANRCRSTKVRENARRYALEIAADYSYPTIRATTRYFSPGCGHGCTMASISAVWMRWRISPRPRNHLRTVPPQPHRLPAAVVRDFHHGMMVPHIAAGQTSTCRWSAVSCAAAVRFPAPLVQGQQPVRCGIQRIHAHDDFQGFPDGVFHRRVAAAAGRLLQPKGGMLAMTLQSYLRDHSRPIVFIPIYFGYERVMEGKTYVAELSGRPKEKESIFGLLKTIRDHRARVRQSACEFRRADLPGRVLDRLHQGWRDETLDPAVKAPGCRRQSIRWPTRSLPASTALPSPTRLHCCRWCCCQRRSSRWMREKLVEQP